MIVVVIGRKGLEYEHHVWIGYPNVKDTFLKEGSQIKKGETNVFSFSPIVYPVYFLSPKTGYSINFLDLKTVYLLVFSDFQRT